MKDISVLAYTAGIIDGEGCVQYVAWKDASRPSIHGYVRVSVGNTDLRLIGWLQANFGGHITTRRKIKDHHKQSWDWVLSCNEAINFLKQVIPYLLIKKERSEFLVQNIASVTTKSTRRKPELDAKKIDLRNAMRAFNKKGEPPATTNRDGSDPEKSEM